jgi:transposase InsO family protein
VGHRRVGRLTCQSTIQAIRTRKCKATTGSDHSLNISPNPLGRDFQESRSENKWAGGITFIRTREIWVYMGVILELPSSYVVGWMISNCLKDNLAICVLTMASTAPDNKC